MSSGVQSYCSCADGSCQQQNGEHAQLVHDDSKVTHSSGIILKLPRLFRIAQQSDEAVVIGGVGDGDEVGSLLVSNGVSTDKTAYGAVL